ncbi:MAG: DNA polymerase III subunit alpha [Alphaproteobacteria bacterium MarineAlpha5_Bin8]|nr:MAG: DNA polymerase III subunit alpha [Alphaproteobacteria bacterium MarineAlpha5_Bin7]PPR47498.1 MAG: DNA polymerase III subunit alpha [Alphaproteobacteria bacterium MarineAlpha5_Bin8]
MKNFPYIHLRTHSSYSLAESTLKIAKIVELAKKNNMPSVALTDNNNLFGALEFSIECINNGIQPIVGSSINYIEISNVNIPSQISFLVKNEQGYKNLLNLSSIAHTKRENSLGITFEDIKENHSGLICFIGGEFNPLMLLKKQNKIIDIDKFIKKFKQTFSDNFYFEIQRINNPDIKDFENDFINIAHQYSLPIISSNNVKYENKEDHFAHDALLCIAQKATINQENRIFSDTDTYFKTSDEMLELFSDIPQVVENNFNLSLKCQFYPKEIAPKLPKFVNNLELTEEQLLIQNSKKGLDERLKNYSLNEDEYMQRLNYEVDIIIKMGFAGYFLIVADFVKWAKTNNIPVGPGRGSGAGSVVAWALTITDLDPIKYGLLFERFLNPERVSMPDFDIDFCQDRRDEVIDYVSKKYGKNNVAHIITFGTLASRAAIRDVGRVLEVPYSEVDQFAKLFPYNPSNPLNLNESVNSDNNLKEIINKDERISNVFDISLKLEGLHRHASTHAAGLVIGDTNLTNNVPLYKDPNTELNATQFSMKYVEKAGLIKFDFLGLTTLTIIQATVDLIKKSNKNFDINNVPTDDEKTFEQLRKGEAVGVFQLESNGMSSVLKQLQPDRFEEIIAVVALFRPGPMDYIPSFCNRKHGREKIDYLHPLLEPILKETYGIIVYQEQVMQIAQVLSNYSPGEADLLRRAMGKKIQKEMDAQKNRFIEGAQKNGINVGLAYTIFDLVDKFAGYGFNKSHAAGYALLAYQTAYLKTNFPYEFMTSSLNYSIDRTDKIILLKKELYKLNIEFKKPDINFSKSFFSIEEFENKKSIRFALGAIKGVGVASMNKLLEERNKNGNFIDIIDFMNRLQGDTINKRQIEKLIQSGAFDTIYNNRAKLFVNVKNFVEIYGGINSEKNSQSMLFEDNKLSFDDKNLFIQNIDEWSLGSLLKNELEVIGFYFSNHPISLYPKNYFKEKNIIDFEEIYADKDIHKAKLAGSILDIKERSNKEGKKYAFLTISNEKTQFELSIFSNQLSEFRSLIKEGSVLIFHVDISRDNENLRMIIRNIEDLDKVFSNEKFKINLYLSGDNYIKSIDSLVTRSEQSKNDIFIYFNKNQKLISLNFSKNYEINNYASLDQLNDLNKIDYSLEIL